jgi:hypothetical protein
MAHGIIPHHHYDEKCALNRCNNQQSTTDEGKDHDTLPWHCQAFIHVVFTEQQLLNKFKRIDPRLFEFSCFEIAVDLYQVTSNICFNKYTGEQIACSCPLPQSPLRAPPELG